jgi:aubergine-like protein
MNEKQLPEKIIVYRDGVGAGDIARLKDTEVAALRVIMNSNGL